MRPGAAPAGGVGFRRPGGRLRADIDPRFAAHGPERGVPLLPAVHAFDRAHIVALAESGHLHAGDAVRMLRALADAAGDDGSGVIASRQAAGGGIHSGEQLLAEALGDELGGRICLARSSADLGAVALRILLRDGLLALLDALGDLRRTVIDLARRHAHTVLPMYAQGQHAQPTTLGHVLAAWASVLERDAERLLAVVGRVALSPAGAAIGTGSPFVLDRARTAALLGFDAPVDNTLDAVTSHDHVLDVASSLAIHAGNLSRWADDVTAWSSVEHGFVRFPDRWCGTSSILAQARSAYVPQFVRGVGAALAGVLVQAIVVDRATTGAAVLERTELSERLGPLLVQATRDVSWWAELLPELEWDAGRMEQVVGADWASASDIAGALVRRHGLPWRRAHRIAATVVRLAEERAMGPADVTPALVAEAARLASGSTPERAGGRCGDVSLSQAELLAALDPHVAVAARSTLGGPAPDELAAQLDRRTTRLAADTAAVDVRRRRIDEARTELDRAVCQLTASVGPDEPAAA